MRSFFVMADSFIHLVLEDLQKRDLAAEECTFIVPSQRTAIQLKRTIGQLSKRALFSPPVYTLTEWVAELCQKQSPSSSSLLLELFEAYRIIQTESEWVPFQTFMTWAPGLLSDFDQIDRYRVPAEELFEQLTELERIKRWDPSGDSTPLIDQHLAFCALLFPLYNQLNKQLADKAQGYSGALFREASELRATQNIKTNTSYVLLGFNALSTSESKLFQFLLEERTTHLYWDIDRLFLDQDYHDAGLFIRAYTQQWPYYKDHPVLGLHEKYQEAKKIRISKLPHPTTQAHYAGEWLKSKRESDSAALILADEELLPPLLQCIPDQVETLNITMGLPLKEQQLYQALDLIWQLEIRRTDEGWLSSDLRAATAHPRLSAYLRYKGIPESSLQRIGLLNLPERLNAESLSALLAQFVLPEEIFRAERFEPLSFLQNLLDFLPQVDLNTAGDHQSLGLLLRLLEETRLHCEQYPFLKDSMTVYALFAQSVRQASLDFIGNPFEGTQLMGILESRNLAFREVMITSLNEGILPKGEIGQSVIPYELQKHYGLPTTKEKDALFTYHFYRVLQWSQNIELVYSAPTDALMGGEPSRFIQQLLAEPMPAHTVEEESLASPVQIHRPLAIKINKSPGLLVRLQQYAEEGFSPSSLSLYLRNPLDFYKRYVLRIPEIVQTELGLAPRLLGNVVHQCLEWLYEPVLNQNLDPAFYENELDHIPQLVKRGLLEELPGQETHRGKYVLIQKVIERYLHHFLEQEKALLESKSIRVLSLEQQYKTHLNKEKTRLLKGTLDRVEEVDGKIRIADYKTGKLILSELEYQGIGEDLREEKSQKRFQLLCYALLYKDATGHIPDQVGIYPIKDKGAGLQSLFERQGRNKTSVRLEEKEIEAFRVFLNVLIDEIMDPEIPFIENLDP